MQIGVKAIGILTTKNPVGWSLLLMIYGQFPPIQLSWGFTLTGVGGLIGAAAHGQHRRAVQGISSGSLDAILFPENPGRRRAADHQHAAHALSRSRRAASSSARCWRSAGERRTWSRSRSGVLIDMTIGDSVELNSSCSSVRRSCSCRRWSAQDAALLYLQVDFVGSVVFDPFKIAFDGKLRNSRVLVITLTGSFCFRASFGDHPSFLLSAGGFHPRFKDIPADVPKMDRLGAGFSIGIIGIRVETYFAITSATVQSGAEVAIWGDVGRGELRGRVRLRRDLLSRAEVLFRDRSARVCRRRRLRHRAVQRAHPRHARGAGKVARGGPRDDRDLRSCPTSTSISTSTGAATPARPRSRSARPICSRAEIEKVENWAAQLPADGESYVTLAKISGVTTVLAHPRSPLTFQQKLVPLGKRLKRIGVARIEGPRSVQRRRAHHRRGPPSALRSRPCRTSSPPRSSSTCRTPTGSRVRRSKRYDAGITMAVDDFECGPIVAETLDYEEVNLSGGTNRFRKFYLDLAGSGQLVASSSAPPGAPCCASATKLEPAVKAKIDVDPAALRGLRPQEARRDQRRRAGHRLLGGARRHRRDAGSAPRHAPGRRNVRAA